MASRRNLTLTRASTAPTNERIRIQGQPGFWYRITAGTLAGDHVQEQFAIVALQGRSVYYRIYPARRATMAANKTFTGFEFAANGSGAEPGDRHDDRGDVVRRRRLRAVERPGIPARRDRSAGRPLDQPGHAGH